MAQNPFISIVAQASEHKWCLTPFCTTCGCREYRTTLAQLAGPLGEPLCNALRTVSPDDLMRFPDWDQAIEIAILDLSVVQVESVLKSWLLFVGERPKF